MSLALGRSEFLLLPTSPLHKRATHRHNYRAWKRRRIKPLTVQNQLNNLPSSFEHLFQRFIEIFPSTNALSYIAPALGLAFYLSGNSRKQLRSPNAADNLNFDIGEWILFASPTPFNRFVTLRCPSICFPGNDMLENVNEKLVKEDRHYVKLRSGRITEHLKSDGEIGEKMVYQRICVGTEDGGVLALDWPANLEMEEERGLDTTVLIVPGTVEGSNERKIRLFVYECLRGGLFPVVMNPRGCAGSPLTTARLFTAADSDDVSTVVRYVNKRRPWTTLMGVGWGYSANMLTKYLAEFGERTPLTAAACIDNPFDLEEAVRSSVNHVAFDQQHTSGLISILESNKELFQGRGKGFDVTRALSALTVRDFEKSISMVSYGFDNIADFYAKSSTRDVIGKVKIPVLFIQNDGKFPLYSIPRGLIAENVYTSLLLCSYSPFNKTMDDRSMLSWCQNLATEWLIAVELGLLKGRHPLLKDVDVIINPSTDLALAESEASSSSGRDALSSLTNGNSSYPSLPMLNANGGAASTQSNSTQDKRQPSKITDLADVDNNEDYQSSTTIDAEIVDEKTNSSATEKGQVLQSAEVVMNMLDVTMPNVLSDEQKNKVLSAMGQGETLINALQGAVPEDVRGKLTSAVSGILESHGSDLKFDKILSLGHIPDIASKLNLKVLEKINDSKANSDEGVNFSDHQKMCNDSGDGLGKLSESSEKPTGDVDLENQSSEKSKKPNATGMVQSDFDHGNNSLDLEKGNLEDMRNSLENEQLSENIKPDTENVSELNANHNFSPFVGTGSTEDIANNQQGVERSTVDHGNNSLDLEKGNLKDMGNSLENEQLPENIKPDAENLSELNADRNFSPFEGTGGTEDIAINQQGVERSTVDHGNNSLDLEKGNLKDMGNSLENEQLPENIKPDAENVSDLNADRNFSPSEGTGGTEDFVINQQGVDRSAVAGESDQVEANNKHKHEMSTDQNKVSNTNHAENQSSVPSPASETQVTVDETESNQKNEEKKLQPIPNQNIVAPASFDVSQALDAFQGFDDSTQVAVNSVFHVIEDMIDQVEKNYDNELSNGNNRSEVDGIGEVNEPSNGSVSENYPKNNHPPKSGRIESLASNKLTQFDSSGGTVLHDSTGYVDKQQEHIDSENNNSNSDTSNTKSFNTENVVSDMPAAGELSEGNFPKYSNSSSVSCPSSLTGFPYGHPLYKKYLKTFLCSKIRDDMGGKSALSLNYIPEDGQWNVSEEHKADYSASVDEFPIYEGGFTENQAHSRMKHTDKIIEPSYVILDSGKLRQQNEELMEMNMIDDNIEFSAPMFDNSMPPIKTLILECLNVEVSRKTSAAATEELGIGLARDIEHVANVVSLVIENTKMLVGDNISELRTLDGENLIKVISCAVEETQYLKRVLPGGVIVGSTLAALGKFFDVSALEGIGEKKLTLGEMDKSRDGLPKVDEKDSSERILKEAENKDILNIDNIEAGNEDLGNSKSNELMVGAFTAALGASALLVHHQAADTDGIPNELREKESSLGTSNLEERPERVQTNIITSLAEKAMSVASPVVPTKEDGKLDHERLVSMLAELGQKGGIWQLVGKVALLWGGIRGAMSLADKLISFLRIAERPLFLRIPGFVFMVLLLWSPVIVPLLPSLIQSWATHNPIKFAEFTCIVGLYISVMIMITLWGKRIHKYDDPLLQYGLKLDSASKQVQNFLKGLVGGLTLVFLIYLVNSSLGFVHLTWPSTLSSSSSEPVLLMRLYGRMLMLCVKGIVTLTSIAVVEELLFRSWLPQEIEVDLGYHRGIIISGFVFALLQRSTWEIPGLWLLSLILAGARQRTNGSLWLPIGLRTGILLCNFIFKTGGFLTYMTNFPLWIIGGRPFHPFSGIIGLSFSLVLAIILYPKQPLQMRKPNRIIRQ